ncbi:1-acyl-sn-glycerol-3-phosphate acyltransferase [Actinoplanes campanulatus]|uniref:1-acyl-sn-glycerol-3-phosphate acyltransferase n=1 Tax=Actinoplanes campanulatus TaxID=113559 RepID=A0A7W5ATE3_9ACTN|nr:lysophospholipid acyltransferase family protein [Actinoplanes campanulatus]MBB3101509.1 1-acyl-sn-glycerol-3-phosphate acyltransferase [Actinoplanes campanulatus]GGN50512.1 hypothetical protein GCM10010109_89730 [Actinoplanes campanulatus]GID42105.1 hypothetical protein Aca09nite_86110 [Actinoplanes campanulatus]
MNGRTDVASPCEVLAGANLDRFPFHHLLSRAGFVYIRRSIAYLPLYQVKLRAYIARLIRHRRNLCWSIEGGRTRTGKLRPPVYGVLRYVIDALDADPGARAVIVPVAVVYEQLHEVGRMIAEARGEAGHDPRMMVIPTGLDPVWIDRSNPASARRTMDGVVSRLRDGTSILVLPEGTRMPTPIPGRFKKGAFHIDMQAGVPIVLRNTGDLAWRRSLLVNPGTVDVAVLDPIPPTAGPPTPSANGWPH